MENNNNNNNSEDFDFENTKGLVCRLFDIKILKNVSIFLKPIIIMSPLLPLAIIYLYTLQDNFKAETYVKVGIVLAGCWVYLGPILIYNHYKKVYSFFWESLYKLDNNINDVLKVQKEINKNYRLFDILLVFSWITLIVLTLIINYDRLKIVGVASRQSFGFYFFLLAGIVGGYLTGQGLSQSLKMVYSIKYVSTRVRIPFDIMNYDGLGNFDVVAKYCFSTTIYLTSGVLFIPILIAFSNASSTETTILPITLIVTFSFFIFVSMVYPLFRGYYMASESKNEAVIAVKTDLNKAIETCLEAPNEKNKILMDTINFKLKLLNDIPTYPFQIDVVLKIILTTLIPIFTFFLQMFLTKDIVMEMFSKFM